MKFPQEASVLLREMLKKDVMILADQAIKDAKPRLDASLIVEHKLDSSQIAMLSMKAEGWQDCWDFFKSLALDMPRSSLSVPYLLNEEISEDETPKPKN